MPDDPRDTQARRLPDGQPPSEGRPTASPSTATGAVKPQAGPEDRTEAEIDPGEPMTNEPIPVSEDEPGVGLTPSDEESVEGMRGM